jgi:DNA-binding NarL/FixJ family response regulator
MSTTNNDPIRVLIADGDPLVSRALVNLLHNSTQVDVIATAADGGEALALAREFAPAIALVDSWTNGGHRLDGIKLIRRLCRQSPATRIVALGVFAMMRDQALAAGACRFLLKDCSRDTLVAAILLAASGHCEVNGPEIEPDPDT